MWDNEQTATLTECKEEPEDEYIPQVEGCSSNSFAATEPVDHPSEPVKNDGQQIVIADDDEIAPNYLQPNFNQQQFNQQQQFPQMFYHMQNNQTVYQDQQHHSGQWQQQQQQAWQASLFIPIQIERPFSSKLAIITSSIPLMLKWACKTAMNKCSSSTIRDKQRQLTAQHLSMLSMDSICISRLKH